LPNALSLGKLAENMKPRILVVGSLNLDLVARVPNLPQPGETVPIDSFIQSPGGKGANQAVAAARLGALATMLGCVGNDSFGATLLTALRENGVATTHVRIVSECASGVALIGVERSGQNAIMVAGGANLCLLSSDVQRLEHLFAAADAVLLQLEIPIATVAAACQLAKRHGVLVVLDPAPAPSVPLPDDLCAVDLISPNQSEAESLTGIAVADPTDAARAAAVLRGRGARQVVVKLGAQGAVCCDHRGDISHVPAPQVQAIDTTAAGDAFGAALAIALVEGRSLAEAAQFACAAGALATTRCGAQEAMPWRAAVDELVAHCPHS